MGSSHLKNSPPPTVIAPVFWAWAQQQAAPEEPLHLTRRRAIEMQLQADADLAKAMHREASLRSHVGSDGENEQHFETRGGRMKRELWRATSTHML